MLCFPMLISPLPGANPPLPEHKIGVFVRFWGWEPLFSGISSTKSRFLCAFGVGNPRFRAFRAQNLGFCALIIIKGHREEANGHWVMAICGWVVASGSGGSKFDIRECESGREYREVGVARLTLG